MLVHASSLFSLCTAIFCRYVLLPETFCRDYLLLAAFISVTAWLGRGPSYSSAWTRFVVASRFRKRCVGEARLCGKFCRDELLSVGTTIILPLRMGLGILSAFFHGIFGHGVVGLDLILLGVCFDLQGCLF